MRRAAGAGVTAVRERHFRKQAYVATSPSGTGCWSFVSRISPEGPACRCRVGPSRRRRDGGRVARPRTHREIGRIRHARFSASDVPSGSTKTWGSLHSTTYLFYATRRANLAGHLAELRKRSPSPGCRPSCSNSSGCTRAGPCVERWSPRGGSTPLPAGGSPALLTTHHGDRRRRMGHRARLTAARAATGNACGARDASILSRRSPKADGKPNPCLSPDRGIAATIDVSGRRWRRGAVSSPFLPAHCAPYWRNRRACAWHPVIIAARARD